MVPGRQCWARPILALLTVPDGPAGTCRARQRRATALATSRATARQDDPHGTVRHLAQQAAAHLPRPAAFHSQSAGYPATRKDPADDDRPPLPRVQGPGRLNPQPKPAPHKITRLLRPQPRCPQQRTMLSGPTRTYPTSCSPSETKSVSSERGFMRTPAHCTVRIPPV